MDGPHTSPLPLPVADRAEPDLPPPQAEDPPWTGPALAADEAPWPAPPRPIERELDPEC